MQKKHFVSGEIDLSRGVTSRNYSRSDKDSENLKLPAVFFRDLFRRYPSYRHLDNKCGNVQAKLELVQKAPLSR